MEHSDSTSSASDLTSDIARSASVIGSGNKQTGVAGAPVHLLGSQVCVYCVFFVFVEACEAACLISSSCGMCGEGARMVGEVGAYEWLDGHLMRAS